MDNNNNFDPMAWASANEAPKANIVTEQPKSAPVSNTLPAVPDNGNELDKAKATVDELLRMGANIAESYDDYLTLGFALADGLGTDGRDLYHQLCAQSGKYREQDCEKKWQECLSKHDGRTTIASFYKMAQLAGVDLSAISRRFPSNPSNPHVEGVSTGNKEIVGDNMSENIYNNSLSDYNSSSNNAVSPNSLNREGNEGNEGNVSGLSGAEAVQYTETFSDKLNIGKLPTLLRLPVETQSEVEGLDKVILSALTLYSGAMPNVFGIYDGKRVFPPLYMLIDAPSGADKGIISDCRQLLMSIEWEIRHQYERQMDSYQQEMAKWNALDKKQRTTQKEPEKPVYRSVFIPANSSATSAYQALADNGEWGVIFETEADTLTQALKQNYGDYSDGLRKAFHHESISYSRRKDDEHVHLDCPRLASLLTCTPGQIPQLLSPQQVENGLANRFLFYNLRSRHEWRNVFALCDEPVSDKLFRIGQRYLELYHDLEKRMENPIQFVLSVEQQQKFNDYFSGLLLEQIGLYGEQLDAFVKRLGLSTFRLAMALTVLRCDERHPRLDPLSQTIVCAEDDFHTSMTIANCLINHTAHVYANLLPHDDVKSMSTGISLSSAEMTLFNALGTAFTTQDAKVVAKSLGITWKTAERYIGLFAGKYHIAERIKNGHYRKKSV